MDTSSFRVVGVRADNSRTTIVDHVTKSQADRIKAMMNSVGAFRFIEIEAAELSAPERDLQSEGE